MNDSTEFCEHCLMKIELETDRIKKEVAKQIIDMSKEDSYCTDCLEYLLKRIKKKYGLSED